MGKVLSHMTMSLDGYIAQPDNQVGELFEWYEAGEVNVPNPNDEVKFNVDDSSADMLRDLTENNGALVTGRTLFDIADGWGDKHPAGGQVVVVTHNPPENAAEKWPNTIFVGDVETAISRAKEVAGDKHVTIASANVTQQALDLGLVDEVCVSLVPVLFGEGVPYFSTLRNGHLMLEDPAIVPGKRALHLRYPVRR